MEKQIKMRISFSICLIISVLSIGWSYPCTVVAMTDTPDWTGSFDPDGTVQYGYSVSAAGDVNNDGYADVIVSAPGAKTVLAYYGSLSGLSANSDWTITDDQDFSGFGDMVSSAGDVNNDGYSDVIISASFYDNGEFNEGKVFVYYGSASGLGATADWTKEPDQPHMYFGSSVACAGDVNCDGYSDIVVGETGYSNGEILEGRVCIYFGSELGLSSTADWAEESNQDWAQWGSYVATAGDVNGDGYSDIIIGLPNYENGETREGRVLLYYGSASGPSDVADWSKESDQEYAFFGETVAPAGDVNNDSYSDIVIISRSGHYTESTPDGDEDRWTSFVTSVYYGSVDGLSSNADWTIDNSYGSSDGFWGTTVSVSVAGDVNDDGYSDVIVGNPSYDVDGRNYGKVYVYFGSPSGLGTAADWSAEPDQPSLSFGYSVSGAGDVNNDGYWDVIIGAPGEGGDVAEVSGKAFLFYGSDDAEDSGNDTNDNNGAGGGGEGCFVSTAIYGSY